MQGITEGISRPQCREQYKKPRTQDRFDYGCPGQGRAGQFKPKEVDGWMCVLCMYGMNTYRLY